VAAFLGEHFAFINTPKTGSKYVTGLFCNAEISVTKLGKGHKIVPEEQFEGRLVVTHVRHPVTFLASLYCHRMRHYPKPWQRDELEPQVADWNWLQFVDNVCEQENWVWDWLHRWQTPYKNLKVFRIEDGVWNQWINLWDETGETYNYKGAIAYKNERVNVRNAETQAVLEQLTNEHLDRIYKSQIKMYNTYNYNKQY
jgi:hypothetical protein